MGDYYYDEWGIGFKKVEIFDGTYYYELEKTPLKEASLQDLDHYNWPDPFDKARFVGKYV